MDTALERLVTAWRGLDHVVPAADVDPVAVA
jgi:hypothetical protein